MKKFYSSTQLGKLKQIKNIEAIVSPLIAAGEATITPPLGPMLGQHGVNLTDFTKEFNQETQKLQLGLPLPTTVIIGYDKMFSFGIQTPSVSFLLKGMLGVESVSTKEPIYISGDQFLEIAYQIALLKLIVYDNEVFETYGFSRRYLQNTIMEIAGTAYSCGIFIES